MSNMATINTSAIYF